MLVLTAQEPEVEIKSLSPEAEYLNEEVDRMLVSPNPDQCLGL